MTTGIPPESAGDRVAQVPRNGDPARALRAAIDRTGYYPDVVADALDAALAGEPVVASFVQHAPTFEEDEVRRHLTVLALTPTRLLVAHTDEHPADETFSAAYASTTTEAIPIGRIGTVVVNRVVLDPAGYRRGGPLHELVLTLGWGSVGQLDLEPAGCADPNCEADHGYAGTLSADDFSIRASAAADGPDAVAGLAAFVRSLSAATHGRTGALGRIVPV